MKNTTEKLADLAKIRLNSDELAAMEKDLESVLGLMDTLRGIEPPEGTESGSGAVTMAQLREDIPVPSMDTELLTSQAPNDSNFTVPKILE